MRKGIGKLYAVGAVLIMMLAIAFLFLINDINIQENVKTVLKVFSILVVAVVLATFIGGA